MPADTAVAMRLATHIDASPTPFHAVDRISGMIAAAGGLLLDDRDPWPDDPGLWAVARGGALVAWRRGDHPPHAGFRIVGAHTDSPNLRVKPNPARGNAGFSQLGVEVYGGVLLNSWLDRDLGVSGRVVVAGPRGENSRSRSGRPVLVRLDRPVLRIPQLAIHLDREVNEKGLVLNRQVHLAPVTGLASGDAPDLVELIAAEHDLEPERVVATDLMLHDLQPATLAGRDDELLSAPRIDNLLSCFVAIEALLAVEPTGQATPMVCLFDHEEVGSVSSHGAASPMLRSVLERLAGGHERAGSEAFHRAMASSAVLSADGAHATHPNYVDRHEPDHLVRLNGGPVLKINANQRYATDAESAALFIDACEAAGVPHQRFVNRSDLACGSTIGPITAAELGVPVVDAGCPQLAMHSIRELCGSQDPAWFGQAIEAFLTG